MLSNQVCPFLYVVQSGLSIPVCCPVRFVHSCMLSSQVCPFLYVVQSGLSIPVCCPVRFVHSCMLSSQVCPFQYVIQSGLSIPVCCPVRFSSGVPVFRVPCVMCLEMVLCLVMCPNQESLCGFTVDKTGLLLSMKGIHLLYHIFVSFCLVYDMQRSFLEHLF